MFQGFQSAKIAHYWFRQCSEDNHATGNFDFVAIFYMIRVRLNIKMSYHYKNSHYKDKTVSRPSYLYNGTIASVKTGPRFCICTWDWSWKGWYISPRQFNSSPIKMAAISLTIFSDAFLWLKGFVLWLKFHWSLSLRVQLTITQHWFR